MKQGGSMLDDKCSVRGCKNKAGIWFPLIGDCPAFCSHHYDNPPKQFKKLIAEANSPPDDFDIPDY
jgi:hypothetical protein